MSAMQAAIEAASVALDEAQLEVCLNMSSTGGIVCRISGEQALVHQ